MWFNCQQILSFQQVVRFKEELIWFYILLSHFLHGMLSL